METLQMTVDQIAELRKIAIQTAIQYEPSNYDAMIKKAESLFTFLIQGL